MDANKMLNEIDNAYKSVITIGEVGDSVLQPQYFDSFVREMQKQAKLLDATRYQEMDSQKVNIDRIAFTGRVLEKVAENAEASDYAEINTKQNQLSAEEVVAVVGLTDQMLRRNIEKEGLEDTIVQLLGEHAGKDLEELGIFASDAWTGYHNEAMGSTQWSAIDLINGWVRKCENKLDSTAPYFSDDTQDVSLLFEELLQTLPKQYLVDRGDWRFYTNWKIQNEYINELKDRGTPLGDEMYENNRNVRYKDIPVEYIPMLERFDNDIVMLQNPDNMVWGVFHEVTLETDRIPKARRTDFVLTFEGDAHYEDENAGVIAVDVDETDDTNGEAESGEHPLFA